MNRSFTYIDALIPEMINIFRKNDYIDELMTYYSEFPILTRNYIIDYLIENNIKKIFRYTKDEETVINLLEKIFMNRQIVTLIHEKMVKPGGVLIYSTCTVNQAENEENVRYFVEHLGLKLESLNSFLPPILCNRMTAEGMLTMIPGLQKSDGFFVARLRKADR